MAKGITREDFGVVAGEILGGGASLPTWVGVKIVGPTFKDITSIAYSLQTRATGAQQTFSAPADFFTARLLVLEGKVFNEDVEIPSGGFLGKAAEPYVLSFSRILLDLNLSEPCDVLKFEPAECRGYDFDSILSVYLASPRWLNDPFISSDEQTTSIARLCVLGNHYQRDGRQQEIQQFVLR